MEDDTVTDGAVVGAGAGIVGAIAGLIIGFIIGSAGKGGSELPNPPPGNPPY